MPQGIIQTPLSTNSGKLKSLKPRHAAGHQTKRH
jgi:hypothetical protein